MRNQSNAFCSNQEKKKSRKLKFSLNLNGALLTPGTVFFILIIVTAWTKKIKKLRTSAVLKNVNYMAIRFGMFFN